MIKSAAPKVELRKVHYAAFASEETSCFRADVYVDGKRVAEVSNDGHGGCNMWHPWNVKSEIDARCVGLPPRVTDIQNEDGSAFEMKVDADVLVDDALTDHLVRKEMRAHLKARIVWTKADGKVYVSKKLGAATMAQIVASGPVAVKAKLKDAVEVLNFMAEDEALAVYRASAQ